MARRSMAVAKSLLGQMLRTSHRNPLELARAFHRPLSTATATGAIPIQQRRKRSRSQQGSLGCAWNTWNTPTIATPGSLATPINELCRRRFSNTRISDPERQLEELLQAGGSKQYQNVWAVSVSPTADPGGDEGSRSESTSVTHTSLRLFPLDSDPRLDRQSRFVLELLQTLQEVGLTHTSDRVTTERCNAILKQLATKPKAGGPSKRSKSNKTNNNKNTNTNGNDTDTLVASVVDHWQRIERAKAILESMESYRAIEKEFKGKIPTELPVPSHDTYFTLLKLYSSAKQLSQTQLDKASTLFDETTMALLEMANEAPLASKAIVERMEASGKLGLVPTSLHWNQILSCYANAIRRPNRPLEAATLLYQLLQPSENDCNSPGSSKSPTDASSFAHALRACADPTALEDYESYRSSSEVSVSSSMNHGDFWKEKEAFAKLSLAVAQRVWKGLQQQQQEFAIDSELESPQSANDHLSGLLEEDNSSGEPAVSRNAVAMNSHHFVHMLKAGRNFATFVCMELQTQEGDATTELRQRHEEWMRRVFRECVTHQRVNIHVLQEVMYQGAVLVYDHEKPETNQHGQIRSILDWVGRVVLPPADDADASAKDAARFPTQWETKIVPALVKKSKAFKVTETSASRQRRLESVYASTIQQTKILLRKLPSRWSHNAD